MDYYVIYHSQEGRIYGISSFMPTDSNIPEGYTFEARMGDLPKDLTLWDSNSKAFVDPQTFVLTKLQFQERLTTQERIAIRTSVDPIVQDFVSLSAIAQEIDLTNPSISNALMYLTAVGILAPGRANEILGVTS